ncbi:MAG: SDR family NAD(P)-dependent oxidoreductase, partial [Syntrophales bacterium]|nr:SDR family NAD(P)-dependent oxidoreductase [Syntrophales bacterium]
MTERLKGHVALVTGGGRGIGRAISERLYREGAELAICGTSSDVLEETAKALQSEGRRGVFWRQCDVSSKESVRALVESAAEQFGKVDILVNNAAVTLGEFGKDRID